MENLNLLTESFKTKYERFIIGCDSIELDCVWEKNEYGEMDVFYENELLSVILSLIIADGTISEHEVKYLNENFGFSYTVDELKNVYINCGVEIKSYFENNFKAGYEKLKTLNGKLAAAYKELFELICKIIVESDGVLSDEEKKIIPELKI